MKDGVIITDVGSAKTKSMQEAQSILGDKLEFIPAHPIAGTEKSGPESGFAELFINRWCIITPFNISKKKNVNCPQKILVSSGRDFILQIDFHISFGDPSNNLPQPRENTASPVKTDFIDLT